MKKKTFLILVLILGLAIIFLGGWLGLKYREASVSGCNFYKLVITGECVCPEGYIMEPAWGITYCITESLKPCNSHADCPVGERCISKDGRNWFCSGKKTGCYHWNPENPEMLCAD